MTRPKTKRAEAKAKVARAAIPQDREILSDKQTAHYLGLKSGKTLYHWRIEDGPRPEDGGKPTCERVGPTYIKFGRGKRLAIRYRRADLDAWVAAHAVG